MKASVFFETEATPTATPTPTNPPARLAVIWTSLVSSRAETTTLLPADSVVGCSRSAAPCAQPAPSFIQFPTHAKVVVLRIVTVRVPATPTVPPLAPATTDTTASLPVAKTVMLSAAFTCAPSSMYASVLSVTRCTPTPTPTPAVPAIASVAATPISWNWLAAATRTDWCESGEKTLAAQVKPQLICAPFPM